MKFPLFLKKCLKSVVGDLAFSKLQDLRSRITGGLGTSLHGNILLENQRAIYFPILKVACSSIKHVCAEILGVHVDDVHTYAFPYAKRYELDKYDTYFKFAFVRNPWDRAVSCYLNKLAAPVAPRNGYRSLPGTDRFHYGMPFDQFVEVICATPDQAAEGHFKSQHAFITDRDGKLLVDFVGRFERLAEDFAHVLGVINERGRRLGRLNHTPEKRDYHCYYNEKTKAMVAERYADDIELFKYDF